MAKVFAVVRHLLLLGLLVGAGGYYLYVRTPCHLPIRYTAGALDPRFKLSEAQLLEVLNKAAKGWEDAAGTNLFEYQKGGSLPINLVYDSRQATTQKNNVLKEKIDQTSGTADSVKAAYNAAQTRYVQAKAGYAAAQVHYADSLAAYNKVVAYWNARGGAPQGEYAALQSQKAALEAEAAALESKRLALNAQAGEVNTLSAQYNKLAEGVNATVDTINKSAGREFEEGLYTANAFGAKIDIYEYSDTDKLVRVLAHELGHSLGLDHNTNPESIMYELNQSENTTPTKEDLADLRATCRI